MQIFHSHEINSFHGHIVVLSEQFAASDSAMNKKRSHMYISNNWGPKTDTCVAPMITDDFKNLKNSK